MFDSVFRRLVVALVLTWVVRAFAAEVPITDDEAKAFGTELASALQAGDIDGFLRSVDLLTLARRVVAGLELEERERSEIVAGLASGMRRSLGTEFSKWKYAHAGRVSAVDGEKRVLLRVVAEDGACNFLDLVCARKAVGGLKAVDFHSMLSGELASASGRQAMLPALAQQKKSFLERLTSKESAYVAALPTLQRAIQDNQAGQPAKALAAFESLPREVQVMPLVLLHRLQAAYKLEEKRYLAVIEDWEQARPGDPSLSFVSIDGHFLRKDYDAAVRSILEVQKQTGPDAHLQMLCAVAQHEAGRPDAAVAAIRRAVEIQPSHSQSFDFWFGIELGRKNWPGLVAAIGAFEAANPQSDLWAAIAGEEAWADFRESDECRAWRAKATKE